VGKKEIYDSFRMKIGGNFVGDDNSFVTLRTMVQRAIDKTKQKGIKFFLQTENEPPETIMDARGQGRPVKCANAGTVTIQGKTISSYVYPTSRGRASRPKREEAG
jgi:hypothetical protein